MKQEARLEVGWRPRGGRSEAALGVKDGDPTIEGHAYRYRATLGPQCDVCTSNFRELLIRAHSKQLVVSLDSKDLENVLFAIT